MSVLKTVLITGCSDGGIGSALAIVFQQAGYHVFATARDPSKMGALQTLPNITFLTLDVVKPGDIQAAVGAVAKYTGEGTLDCLINNAGRNHFMPILDENLDAVRALFEINFIAPLALTKAFAPMLIKAEGMAVYLTSTSGYLNIPFMGTYAASKRSTEIVAETLRPELAPFGVGVLEVVTGAVRSQGQTYFGDFELPPNSLYKSIEPIIASRAQGNDMLPRMDTLEYANEVCKETLKRTSGRIWQGGFADMVKQNTTAPNVPQDVMDANAVLGTGLDAIGK
ncbi:hypothetical protein F4808DRAFT_412694 [Astrocystis sublimbata]|nr:hypothetical protein F4808DRAFT_412694 [Astrocystis sublimbata]